MSDNTQIPNSDLIASDDIGGVKYQRVKLVLGADGVNDGDLSTTNPLPASDATAQATLAAIQTLSDTMLYMVTAMLDKMPRLTRDDRVSVSLSSNSDAELNSPYFLTHVSAVGDASNGRTVSRMMEPWNFSDAGSARIYQQITVS